MNKTSVTCYMCSAPKTSVEHVPPKGLFPKSKDLPAGMNLRKQLITVPACDLHNTEKSHDDEYLMYPDGHPNSPTSGHLKFPHPEVGVTMV